MIDEFALWLGCNVLHGDLALCAINTLLIAPGVMGLFSIFLLYFFAIFFLIYIGGRSVVRALRRLK
jgi:hypothetical protein